MLEAYAFFAAFTAQILAMSIVYPPRVVRSLREEMARYPEDRLPQPQGPSDFERTVALYRPMNLGVATLGVLLLGGLFSYMRRPDWDDGPVEGLIAAYFVLQMLPLALIARSAFRFNKALRLSSAEEKRKASLQRRGLFDFVSPFAVFLAASGYFLYVAFVLYIEQHPFPGFAGPLANIGMITLLYAVMSFAVYGALYGRKSNPLVTHADRIRTIGLIVKVCVYTCTVCVVFNSLNFTLVLLDLQRWEPFAQSVFMVTCALLCFMSLNTLRPPEANGCGSTPVPR
jgi:hypothetical protein